MGKWRHIWLHLRKTDEVKKPEGALNEGLLIKGPTVESAFGVPDLVVQPRSSLSFSPTSAVPIDSVSAAAAQPILKGAQLSAEVEKRVAIEKFKATKVDVFRVIHETGRPNYPLAALMLRQIFLVKHRASEDSWPKYQAALSKSKEEHMYELDMGYQCKIRAMAKRKKSRTKNPDRNEKKRAYKNYVKIRDATLKYVKSYLDLMNEMIQTMDIEATKYEEISRRKKIILNEKTQQVTDVALQIKTRLDLQFNLIKSATSLIDKIKSATEGLLTLKGIRGAIGIVSSYIVVIAGAKFTVTTQKFKQGLIDFFTNSPTIEKIINHGMIYIQWIAGTLIALAGMGLFTKGFEIYYKRRLARKEATELSVSLGKLNEEINELKIDIRTLNDERDDQMEELIATLKEPISVLENEYNSTVGEQKTDLIVDGAVLKHFDDIQCYLECSDESKLFPAIKRIIKRSKGSITFAEAKGCLLKRINGMNSS